MIDKLKIWNYVSLHDSMLQYRASGNEALEDVFMERLDRIWYSSEYFSQDDVLWISKNCFSEPFGWDRPEKAAEVMQLVKDFGKPVVPYESMSEQLSLRWKL